MMKSLSILRACALAPAAALLLSGAALGQTAEVNSASPLENKDAARAETTVGDLYADAVRWAVKADIAFVAASELKAKDAAVPAGTISAADIAALASYPDDPLAEVGLTGAAVRQALEKSVSMYPQPSLGFLQVSGLSFEFDPARKSGERVTDVRVAGSALNDSSVYKVAMSNSLANGALGYWKTWSKSDIRRKLGDVTMVGALNGFLKANPSIDYGRQDRIKAAR